MPDPRPLAVLRVGIAVTAFIAFASLARDAPALFGPHGLAPAEVAVAAVRNRFGDAGAWARMPTLFYVVAPSDDALTAFAWLGALLSVGLAWPRLTPWLALPLAFLYLSFASAGTVFYSFQWDSLLVETLFTCVLLSATPGRAAIWVFRLLLLRLYVESGLAKVLWSDDWSSGVAMSHYWVTTPLPTPLAWWADRLPAGVQTALTYGTVVGEGIAPFGMFFGRRARVGLFVGLTALQVGILATGNYAVFNWLSLVLGVSLLVEPNEGGGLGERLVALIIGPMGFVVALNVFLPSHAVADSAGPLQRWRLANAYHLFVDIDPLRYEVEVVGTDDGDHWYRLPLAYKPPAPMTWVAPYQPRLAFRLWFSTLGARTSALGFAADADDYLAQVAASWCDLPAALRPFLTREVRSPVAVSLAFERNGFAEDHVGWATTLLGRHPVAWRCGTDDTIMFPQPKALLPLDALGEAPTAPGR